MSKTPPRDEEKPLVLVVDDEESNLLLIENTLDYAQCRVHLARDGQEALDSVAAEAPDIILLDVMMPRIDGFEVCRRLKSDPETRAIPVIVLTALDQANDHARALDMGADDFMTKPFNPTILQARLRSYIRAKRLADEVRDLQALKTDLTRMIVHDLNGPVFGVMGYLDLIAMSPDLPEKAARQLGAARRSAQEISRMIANLLDIDRMEAGHLHPRPVPFDWPTLIAEAIEPLRPAWEARELTLDLKGPQSEMAKGDKDLLRRVVQNLVGNAVKFADPDHPVRIRWSLDGALRFAVANRGRSIAPQDQPRIFDKFAQVGDRPDAARQGCGLGLAFCRMAVEAHGGHIELASPPENWPDGVEFSMHIPQDARENGQGK